MKLATVPFAAALLLFVHFGKSGPFPKPQARPAPITGVILQSYEAVNGTWIAHLVNLSHKEVVVVSISPKPYVQVTKSYGCYFSDGATVDDCDGASYPGWYEYFLLGETKDLELRGVREEQINPSSTWSSTPTTRRRSRTIAPSSAFSESGKNRSSRYRKRMRSSVSYREEFSTLLLPGWTDVAPGKRETGSTRFQPVSQLGCA